MNLTIDGATRQRLAGHLVIASVSGGKDSAAMSLFLKENGIEHERVFNDTRWEDDRPGKFYDYLRGPLTEVIGPVTEIRAPHGMVALILKKGMFPSRQRRFCTEELKVFPVQRYMERRMEETGLPIVNVVGIRSAESEARAKLGQWDHWQWKSHAGTRVPVDCDVWRPILVWSEAEVIEMHKRHNLVPNPLYLEGASRVGCFPCIMARKSEIRRIADQAPERIDLIRRLEERVGKRAAARYAAKGETFESLGYLRPAWFQDPEPVRTMVDCDGCDGAGHFIDPAGDITCQECKGPVSERSASAIPSRSIRWSSGRAPAAAASRPSCSRRATATRVA
jgi:3'-phosphoadenosine 5'-phosphosulfate sulfotransferase (PAPS reductase)/FAD synthetase